MRGTPGADLRACDAPHPNPLPGGEGVGIVTGLAAEARIARPLGIVAAGGGRPAGAEAAALRLMAQGASALVSFGLAGGLDPALPSGAVVLPATVLLDSEEWRCDPALAARLGARALGAIYGGGQIVATRAAKSALHARTGAIAVDLESAAVARVAARFGLPFAVLRAICDPADRALPRAALVALDQAGRIGPVRVAWAVLSRPQDIPALIRLGGDAARARHALVTRVRGIGRL